MVEEYVRDLYRIALIMFLTPVFLTILGLVLAILGQQTEGHREFMRLYGVALAGFLIMLYLSIKYYYGEGRHGKT